MSKYFPSSFLFLSPFLPFFFFLFFFFFLIYFLNSVNRIKEKIAADKEFQQEKPLEPAQQEMVDSLQTRIQNVLKQVSYLFLKTSPSLLPFLFIDS